MFYQCFTKARRYTVPPCTYFSLTLLEMENTLNFSSFVAPLSSQILKHIFYCRFPLYITLYSSMKLRHITEESLANV